MNEDWMNRELRNQYRRETNKFPLYADLPTDDYKRWLEKKDLEKGIKMVIDEEERLKNNGD